MSQSNHLSTSNKGKKKRMIKQTKARNCKSSVAASWWAKCRLACIAPKEPCWSSCEGSPSTESARCNCPTISNVYLFRSKLARSMDVMGSVLKHKISEICFSTARSTACHAQFALSWLLHLQKQPSKLLRSVTINQPCTVLPKQRQTHDSWLTTTNQAGSGAS